MGLSHTLNLLEEIVWAFDKALIVITRRTQTPNGSQNILQWVRVSPQQSLKKTLILKRGLKKSFHMSLSVDFNGSEAFKTRVFSIQDIKSVVNKMKAEILFQHS